MTVTAPSAREPSEPPVPQSSAELPTARERVRELLQTEVDKHGPLEDTRRAAVLIGESSIRFIEEPGTGFVIVGPDGQPRTSVQDGRSVPFTLADLAAELQRNYPALFKQDAPDATAAATSSEPAEELPGPRDWLMVGSGEPSAPPEADVPAEAVRQHPEGGLAAPAPVAPSHHERGQEPLVPDRPRRKNADPQPVPDILPVAGWFRPSYAIYAGIVLVIGTILALIFSSPGSEPAPNSSASGQQATAGSAAAPAGTVTPVPAPAQGSPTPPGALSGVPEVVDTSTLRIDGKVVRLFGVEWERGAQAEDLTRYIAGREAVCTPAVRSDRHRCQIEGRDLSEVILYNGGGRATSEATPELKAAEAKARAGNFGIWQKPGP